MKYLKLSIPDEGVHLYENIHKKEDYVAGHYHDDYQILYALDGSGKITVDSSIYEFKKDTAVLLVPNSQHSIEAHAKLTVLVLAFSKEKLAVKFSDTLFSDIEAQSTFYDLDPFSASELRQLLRKLLFEQNNSKEPYRNLASPLFLLEMLLIFARINKRTNFSDANEMRSTRIKEYINSHYFENIHAETLASKFGISTRYMNDIFKSYYNVTPMQHLQHVRINRAKSLLIDTDKEIVSICFEVGYETLSTFYRSFKNTVGMSPHKFRTTNYVH
ncbi:AraC family transcriptional regulator [Evansella sp. AB-P1]|uniref:AraC family transcriptional regulator n=1 Tax=Evansella sp. AB-P1 TaxID=3037653 RepID=UPI00241F4A7D|nr:AraC family transcriptional regulator [Evansella sp. AB-P1]MDG5787135.1 AraC family transcriptional regulator [Evansella sp. AB-P1]